MPTLQMLTHKRAQYRSAKKWQTVVSNNIYIYIYDVFTVFIHSATNVTLDITFTSYITFLTYKHY